MKLVVGPWKLRSLVSKVFLKGESMDGGQAASPADVVAVQITKVCWRK